MDHINFNAIWGIFVEILFAFAILAFEAVLIYIFLQIL